MIGLRRGRLRMRRLMRVVRSSPRKRKNNDLVDYPEAKRLATWTFYKHSLSDIWRSSLYTNYIVFFSGYFGLDLIVLSIHAQVSLYTIIILSSSQIFDYISISATVRQLKEHDTLYATQRPKTTNSKDAKSKKMTTSFLQTLTTVFPKNQIDSCLIFLVYRLDYPVYRTFLFLCCVFWGFKEKTFIFFGFVSSTPHTSWSLSRCYLSLLTFLLLSSSFSLKVDRYYFWKGKNLKKM